MMAQTKPVSAMTVAEYLQAVKDGKIQPANQNSGVTTSRAAQPEQKPRVYGRRQNQDQKKEEGK